MDDDEYAAFKKVAEENGLDLNHPEAGEYGSNQLNAAYWFSLGWHNERDQ